ncbi:MAG: hypothetical protein C4308_04465 [Chitinophagaceae bacterium]
MVFPGPAGQHDHRAKFLQNCSSHRRIRLWFIYISLLTVGSPIIIYMILAFWMNMKRYMKAARRNPWYYL